MEEILDPLKQIAKNLICDDAHPEYNRGICELLADVYSKKDIGHAERACELGKFLGLSEETINKFYE